MDDPYNIPFRQQLRTIRQLRQDRNEVSPKLHGKSAGSRADKSVGKNDVAPASSDKDRDMFKDAWAGKVVGTTDVALAHSDTDHDNLNDAWDAWTGKSVSTSDVATPGSDKDGDILKDLDEKSWLLANFCRKRQIPDAFPSFWVLAVAVQMGQKLWFSQLAFLRASIEPVDIAKGLQLARGHLTDARREKARRIRSSGACLRCIVHRKTCDRKTPCRSCGQPAQDWALGCVRSWDKDLIESVLASIKTSRSMKEPHPRLGEIKQLSHQAQLDKRLSTWDTCLATVEHPESKYLRPTSLTHEEPQNELIYRNAPTSDRISSYYPAGSHKVRYAAAASPPYRVFSELFRARETQRLLLDAEERRLREEASIANRISGSDSTGSHHMHFAAPASRADRTILDLGERVRALDTQLGAGLDGSVETSLREIDATTVQSYKVAESFTALGRDSSADPQHTKVELSEASVPGTALYHSLASQIANSLLSRWSGRRNIPFAAAPDSESPGDLSSGSETSSSSCDLGSTEEASADSEIFVSPQVQVRREQLRHLLLQCNKEGDDKSSQGNPTS